MRCNPGRSEKDHFRHGIVVSHDRTSVRSLASRLTTGFRGANEQSELIISWGWANCEQQSICEERVRVRTLILLPCWPGRGVGWPFRRGRPDRSYRVHALRESSWKLPEYAAELPPSWGAGKDRYWNAGLRQLPREPGTRRASR